MAVDTGSPLSTATLRLGFGKAMVRGKIRERYGGTGCGFMDCITVLFCGPCAVAQEARIVKASQECTLPQSVLRGVVGGC